MFRFSALASVSLLLGACAGLEFHGVPQDDALTYFEPQPALVQTTNPDCTIKTEIISIPGRKRSLSLKNGWGTAKLSASFSNGIITQIGQETDSKGPETITALAGALKTLGIAGANGVKATTCTARSRVFVYRDNELVELEIKTPS